MLFPILKYAFIVLIVLIIGQLTVRGKPIGKHLTDQIVITWEMAQARLIKKSLRATQEKSESASRWVIDKMPKKETKVRVKKIKPKRPKKTSLRKDLPDPKPAPLEMTASERDSMMEMMRN